jgi:ABC-type multidrug transport system ATPase subunit
LSGATLLSARGVSRRYGALFALHPTDLDVHAGEAIALTGPNGAGKSTLLSILAGSLVPSGGRVERTPSVDVGWAPQRPAQYGKLSARENLELFGRLERVAEPGAAAERLLAEFGLPLDGQASGTLSVGMRQRLNVAIALLGEPRVLLLDEPSASLDPEQRRRLWELASGLRAHGGALVFATQNLEEVEWADRVIRLDEGRVVAA